MRPGYIVGALVVVAVIIGLLQWQDSRAPETPKEPEPTTAQPSADPTETESEVFPAPAPEITPIREAPAAEPQPEAAPAVVLPPLADSDEYVLTQIEAWPLPEPWLQRSDLLARVATVLVNTADGKVPRRQVSFLVPGENYPAIKRGERYFVDPAGFTRYDTYLDVLEGIDPQHLAELLTRVEPLLAQAFAQLGVRQPTAALVAETLDRVERLTPLYNSMPASDIELLRPSVMYTYADPDLEALTDLEKQLLRMGPHNLSRLRAYLSEFKKNYELD